MKLERMEALAVKDDYAKNLLGVLDLIVEEAIDKLTDDYFQNKESAILKKLYPRYDFLKRDAEKFDKFERAIYGVLRRFPTFTIERLANSDVNSQEYILTYKKIATFFSRGTRIDQKQPKTFASSDMEHLFNGLAERVENVLDLKSQIMEL